MFEITLNGKTLYYPTSADCNVSSAVIYEKLNDAGYMEITIPYSNPMYEEIEERKGTIIVYKDNVELWYGEVRDVAVDFSKNKSIYVVGEAAYLNDTVQPQRKIKGTKFEILEEILRQHNEMCGAGKEFQIGAIGDNTRVREIVTDWEYTLDAIRNHLCDDEEYFRIRHVNGERFIDIMPLESYGKRSEQNIIFGDNLLDYAEQSSGEKIATVCIPLGATLDEGGIDDYENYLTCEEANDGKNYVELPGAVDRLGRITKVVHFNVLTTPQALVTAAINYLQNSQYAKLTLELSAVDLSILHADIDNYSVGDYVRAICEPMGMDAWFPIRERETDLINIANNKIVIGSEGPKSITSQSIERITNLEQQMPNRESLLNAALKNASNLINANGENGNVSIRVDKDGKPYEILIMNADSLEQSTEAWRWNLNGFGHGSKKAGEPEFTWEANVAMTMDGQIIATKGSVAGFDIYMNRLYEGATYNEIRQGDNKNYIRIAQRKDEGFEYPFIEMVSTDANGHKSVSTYGAYSALVDNVRLANVNELNSAISTVNSKFSNYLPLSYVTGGQLGEYVKQLVWTYLKLVFQGPNGKALEETGTGEYIQKRYNM